MNFSEQLNSYISLLKCSGKELAQISCLSTSVISRYRNNDRIPIMDSEQLKKLSNGIVELALKQGLSNITYKDVLSNFNKSLQKNSISFEHLSKNFDKLLSICNINMGEMARFLSFDASYLSRIRNGQRKPSNPELFVDSVCSYIVRRYNNDAVKSTVADLIGCDFKEIINQSSYLSKLKNWLCSEATDNHNYIDEFLKKLDEFDLDEYIRSIHFDELKVPSIPFQFPNSKNYYGIEEMKKGELDFFKATVLSKSKNSVFMCSDMPMEDMAEDIEFGKKWMYAIAVMLKKGLHLDIIHNLDRPFKEMMLGLESWIPIYMTGQISPYYLKGVQNNIYCNLNYVSGSVALSGECINGNHNKGKYYLTNNKEEVAYYKEKTNSLMSKAQPLMEIYRKNSSNVYTAFINSTTSLNGNRRRILSSLPLFTMPEDMLLKILKHNSVADEDKNKILKFAEQERNLINIITDNNSLLDEITELSKDEFEKYPISLSLSGMFYEKKIYYTYEEYLEHFRLTKEYSTINPNYAIETNNKSAFRNIQIYILESKWVIISKENSPTIHFVIHHPKLCNSIQNFIVPVLE